MVFFKSTINLSDVAAWSYAVVGLNPKYGMPTFVPSLKLSGSNGLCIFMSNKVVHCIFKLKMPINEFAFCFDTQLTKLKAESKPYPPTLGPLYDAQTRIRPMYENTRVSSFALQPKQPSQYDPVVPPIRSTTTFSTMSLSQIAHDQQITTTTNSSANASSQSSLSMNGTFSSSSLSSFNSQSSFFSAIQRTNMDDDDDDEANTFIKPPMPMPMSMSMHSIAEPTYLCECSLPTLREIKALTNQVKGTPEDRCVLCGEVSSKVTHCKKCMVSYCPQCLAFARSQTRHAQDKHTRGRPEMPTCSLHVGRPLTLYCKEDEMLCCDLCFRNGHVGHTPVELNDAVVLVQNTLEKRMEGLEAAISGGNGGGNVEEMDIEAMKKIAKREKKLRKAIDRREEKMFAEIDDVFVGKGGGGGGSGELVTGLKVQRKEGTTTAKTKTCAVSLGPNFDDVNIEILKFGEVVEKESKK